MLSVHLVFPYTELQLNDSPKWVSDLSIALSQFLVSDTSYIIYLLYLTLVAFFSRFNISRRWFIIIKKKK